MKINIITSLFLISALSACDDSGSDSGDHTPAAPYTKLDAVNVVTLGALTTTMTHDHVGYIAYHMASTAQSFSSVNIGTTSFPSTPCDRAVADSGTYILEFSKAARVGFSSGDNITYTFSKCKFNGVLLDGKFKVTALQEIVDLKRDAFAVRYQADLTGFSLTESGISTRMYGSFNVNFSANSAPPGTIDFDFSVPTGQSLTAAVTTSKGDFVMTYGGGASYAGRDTESPDTAMRKLDGSVNVQTKAAGAVPLQISTPVALTGTNTGPGDSFVPNAGTLQVKSSDLTTSTTVSGVIAKVSADSDRNGSLDLVFDSNWTELTTR